MTFFSARLLWPLATSVLVWLALPGRFAVWPVLAVCLVPLFFWLAQARSVRDAFGRGLIAGLLLYPLLIYWIIPVLVRYGGLHWLVSAVALMLLVIYMAAYLGVFGAGYFLLLRQGFSAWLLGIGSLWVGLDWVRSWLFSGFPWMDIGYGLWSVPELIQLADLLGHHGYSFLIVLTNGVIYSWIAQGVTFRQRFGGTVLLIGLVSGATLYGLQRWDVVVSELKVAAQEPIGITQGNIEQGQKWSADQRQRTVEKYVELSTFGGTEPQPALVVWPETALPFVPHSNPLLVPVLRYVQESGVALLTGAPWYGVVQNSDGQDVTYHNSALLIERRGRLGGIYHKSHLVPYGEYVPLKRYMPFLQPLVEAVGDFTPGTIERPLQAGEIKAGVLICFESIFPDLGRQWIRQGANVLVNLTNDAWYGKSSAPYQSWAMSIFRAVETRRSLVRAANTGISGVVDPLGRIRAKSDLFVEWSAVVKTPLLTTITPYVQGGFWFGPGCLLFAALLCVIRPKRFSGRENQ